VHPESVDPETEHAEILLAFKFATNAIFGGSGVVVGGEGDICCTSQRPVFPFSVNPLSQVWHWHDPSCLYVLQL
jgi:formylmethanofuran dehydrogenase subunit A